MEILLISVCSFLVLLGIADALRRIVFWTLTPQDTNGIFIMVEPKNADECEFLIRSAAERIKWMNTSSACKLVCINENGLEEINKICENLTDDFPELVVSNYEDLRYNVK